MAATFQIDVEKVLDNEYWTNRYLVDSASINDARIAGNAIVAAEQAITKSYVHFTKFRVSDFTPGNDNFIIVPIDEPGGLTGASTDYLPLFNVVRVDFQAPLGRPSRKYLKLPLVEGEVSNQQVSSGLIAGVESDYISALLAVDDFCDPDGQHFVTGTVNQAVAMRQLRRGSKRRTTSII